MNKFILKQFIVWLVIFVGVVIFFTLSFIIGENKGTFLRPVNTYKSVFKEAKGIFTGTEVSIQGVRTGNVLKLEFLKDGRVQMTYTVRKKHRLIINNTTVSQLKNKGVLGDRYVSLSTGEFNLEPLPSGSVIPSIPSKGLLDFVFKSNDFQNSAKSVASELSALLAALNNQKTIDNLNKILSSGNRQKITEILETTSRILKKIDSGEGSLGALINNRSVYNRLMTLLGGKKDHNYMEELSKKSSKK